MELDHDSGSMDGTVLQGEYKDRRLSVMALADLLELRQACATDADSLQVLEAYLDRVHDQWREQASGSSAPADVSEVVMNTELALEILGLEEGASEDEIVKVHRALMQKLHPDRGGSDYLAKKINMAKDYLLR